MLCFERRNCRDVAQISQQLGHLYGDDAEKTLTESLSSGDHALLGVATKDGETIACISWLSTQDHLLQLFLGDQVNEEVICHRRLFVLESSATAD